MSSNPERLQKIIAQAGLASRRTAEEWIAEGLVTVNGKTAKLGDKAALGVDAIKVKGKLLTHSANKVYYLFYKPKHVIAMVNEDEEGRPTIKDFVHKAIRERVFTVGRMDYQGEGAILLTNDGELAQQVLKSDHIIRRYHVKVDRLPTAEDVERLKRGGRIEGRSMTPTHVQVAKAYARNALIEISFEGMGQIDVRKFFENKGFFPERVARVGIGHLKAEKIPPGGFKQLEKSSVEALLSQPELARRQIDNAIEGQIRRTKMIREEEEKKIARAEREEAKRGGAKPKVAIAVPNKAKNDRPKSDRFKTDRPKSDRTRSDRATSDRATSDRTVAPGRASFGAGRSSFGADRAERGTDRSTERPARPSRPGGRLSFGAKTGPGRGGRTRRP